jgi:hypothetical protein
LLQPLEANTYLLVSQDACQCQIRIAAMPERIRPSTIRLPLNLFFHGDRDITKIPEFNLGCDINLQMGSYPNGHGIVAFA